MELKTNTFLYNNRYCIHSCIGNGGFGITYVAWDNQLKREVVLKEYFPQYMVRRDVTVNNEVITISQSYDSDFKTGIKKFLYEAQVLATLRNIPEIAEVYDYFQDNNTAYIVMEYIKGKNLKQYIRERQIPYSYSEAMAIILPCLDALGKVHEAGIIHRDFTPDNIIIEDSGKIRIIDFGSSRDYVNNQATMTVMVKHGYAPVEQYSNKVKQAAYTDIYSVCAILYEMVTLTKPMSALDRVASDELFPPIQYNSTINQYQNAAIMKGLSINCQQRYQTTQEASQALSYIGNASNQNVATEILGYNFNNNSNYYNNATEYIGTNNSEDGKGELKKLAKNPIFMISISVLGTLITILIIVLIVNFSNNRTNKVSDDDPTRIGTKSGSKIDNNDYDDDRVFNEAASDDSEGGEAPAAAEAPAAEAAPEAAAEAEPESADLSERIVQDLDVDNESFSLKCPKVSVYMNPSGHNTAVVYFEFTNKTDIPLSMIDVLGFGFVQNGHSLSTDVTMGEEIEEISNVEVPISEGKTILCAYAVEFYDTEANLTVTVYDNFETFSEIGEFVVPIN